ncbi:hypothetical protein Pelo_14605 [Pelomyxa schiedti]|nr:hypothetical protein Pelo_14605 [Pelomyxa schiedti]
MGRGIKTAIFFLCAVAVACVAIDAGYGCIKYSFTCCDNVNYQVFSVTAQTEDVTTCALLDYMFNNDLKNETEECQDAYKKAYCVLSIPQCCSTQNPVVYTTCRSLCEDMFDACSSNLTTPCDSDDIWYDPPCNDGSGGPCP